MYLDHLKGRLLEVRQRKPVVFSSDDDDDDDYGRTRMPRAIMPPPPPSTHPPASSELPTSLPQLPIGATTQQSQELQLALALPSPLSPALSALSQDVCPAPLEPPRASMPRPQATPKRAAQAKATRGPVKRIRSGPKSKRTAPEVISISSRSSQSSLSSSSSSHSSSSSSSSGSSSSSESSDETPLKGQAQTRSPTLVSASKKKKSRKVPDDDDDESIQRRATIKLLLGNLSMLVDNHNKFINAIKQCYDAIAVISEPSKSPLFGRKGKANLRQLNKELNSLKKSK